MDQIQIRQFQRRTDALNLKLNVTLAVASMCLLAVVGFRLYDEYRAYQMRQRLEQLSKKYEAESGEVFRAMLRGLD